MVYALGHMRIGPDYEPAYRILNLGAGVQSSTVLLMACEGQLPKPDLAIFADTQWEPAAVYEWLEYLSEHAEKHSIAIERVTAGNLRQDVLNSIGTGKTGRVGQPPLYVRGRLDAGSREGRLWRKCSRDYKIDPIRKRIRQLLKVEHGRRVPSGVFVEQWFGISLDEVQRMRTPRDPWAINWYPLAENKMTRSACKVWMKEHGHPEPPRSACIGCPFHSDSEWRRLRDEAPGEWQDAVDFDAAVRTGIPGVAGKAYVHRSTVPLSEVDLTTPEDHGQMQMFGDECEGICGV